MSHTFDAYIKVKDVSSRTKIQLTAMVLFLIAIIIEMIYSNYYILVLFAPFFILLNRYRNMKRSQYHYLECTVTTVSLNNAIRLIISGVPDEYEFDSVLSHSSLKQVEFFDDGQANIVCDHFQTVNGKKFKKKKFVLKFDDKELENFKSIMIDFLENK